MIDHDDLQPVQSTQAASLKSQDLSACSKDISDSHLMGYALVLGALCRSPHRQLCLVNIIFVQIIQVEPEVGEIRAKIVTLSYQPA